MEVEPGLNENFLAKTSLSRTRLDIEKLFKTHAGEYEIAVERLGENIRYTQNVTDVWRGVKYYFTA